MKKMNWINWLACLFVIVGALNWGLIGFFGFNLVGFIFDDISVISRVIYCLVGLSGLWMILGTSRCCKKRSE